MFTLGLTRFSTHEFYSLFKDFLNEAFFSEQGQRQLKVETVTVQCGRIELCLLEPNGTVK